MREVASQFLATAAASSPRARPICSCSSDSGLLSFSMAIPSSVSRLVGAIDSIGEGGAALVLYAGREVA